jgi:cation transport ATPase
VLIPLALAWLLLLAAFRLAQDQGWNRVLVGVIAVVVAGASAALMLAAMKASARNREREGAMY